MLLEPGDQACAPLASHDFRRSARTCARAERGNLAGDRFHALRAVRADDRFGDNREARQASQLTIEFVAKRSPGRGARDDSYWANAQAASPPAGARSAAGSTREQLCDDCRRRPLLPGLCASERRASYSTKALQTLAPQGNFPSGMSDLTDEQLNR